MPPLILLLLKLIFYFYQCLAACVPVNMVPEEASRGCEVPLCAIRELGTDAVSPGEAATACYH